MKLGISKKIIGVYVIGLVLFISLAVFSFISLKSFLSMQKESDELTHRIKLIGDFQTIIHRLVMPPNDYLITGDKKEREIFAKLVTESASIFGNIKASLSKSKEEKEISENVEKDFILLEQKGMVLLSVENPVGNKETFSLMKDIDAFAEKTAGKLEKFNTVIIKELDDNIEEGIKSNTFIFRIFISLTILFLLGMILIIFIIKRKVVKPILELSDAANIIAKGNLDYRIKIETGDEIEGLGKEFNQMAQSLKEKINEAKETADKLEKTNRQLDQNILQLYTLYNISKSLTTTLEMEKLLNQVVERVSHALKLHKINIMLLNEKNNQLNIIAGTGINEKTYDISFKVGEGVYGWSALTGQAEIINELRKHPRFKPIQGLDDDVNSLICAPFKSRNKVIGIINAYRLGNEVFDEMSFELLVTISSHVGMALENVKLFEETRILSITDGMTSLYNYRYFIKCLNEELERAMRYKRPLSLIMIDIDFFKNYNDTNGHQKGDELLRGISDIFKKIARKPDIIARYGGEEFTIILPETTKEMALIMAERLRKAIEENPFKGGEKQPGGKITVSLGVVFYIDDSDSCDGFIKRADDALYRAKEEGRNRVVCS